MPKTNLDALFKPSRVAVVGATDKPGHPGHVVMRNLLGGAFTGPIMPVVEGGPSAKKSTQTGDRAMQAVAGVLCYPTVDDLPVEPDLAVVCVPPALRADILERLAAKGCRAAILLPAPPQAGQAPLSAEERLSADNAALDVARTHRLRLLGPDCLGLMVPGAGLNASLAHTGGAPGAIAFVTQSDSLFTTVLDWANAGGVGFSHFISLGDALDVNFEQTLDYLAADPMTKAILLYVETICDARAFMSAARAAARTKPILVMKPGSILGRVRSDRACLIGAPLDQDAVYDVAFRRAGLVRVGDIESLFDGAKTLSRSRTLKNDRLAIVTNGKSLGLLAADHCLRGGALLAGASELSEATREALGEVGLKDSHDSADSGGPFILPFNAPGSAYVQTLTALAKDTSVSALLVLHVPFADAPSTPTAEAVAEAMKKSRKPVLACWLGSQAAGEARDVFTRTHLPHFSSPDAAIRAFLFMVTYRRNQNMLLQTPDSLPTDFFPDTASARAVVEGALQADRVELTDGEAREVLASYGLPVVETATVASAREAVIAADAMGYPVALKIKSPDIEQPFEVGGVVLDLETPEQVWDACAQMAARVHKNLPSARIDGYVVQRMGRRMGAFELFIGAEVDPTFGPVIKFGQGGMAASVLRDEAIALPPLNMTLARELIGRTRVSRLFTSLQNEGGADSFEENGSATTQGGETHQRVDVDDVCLSLIQLSQLVIDIPQIIGVEINPLFADAHGVLALGARIHLQRTATTRPGAGHKRLAIRPYPRELEECVTLKGGDQLLVRPIRPEDARSHYDFVSSMSADDLRMRFFGTVQTMSLADMANFTQIDYDREMAFIATSQQQVGGRGTACAIGDEHDPATPETFGVVRASTSPDNEVAEYAIMVRSELKGQGLGSLLFEKMIRYCRERGTTWFVGETLPENKSMIALAKKFGMDVHVDYEDDVVHMRLALQNGQEDTHTP